MKRDMRARWVFVPFAAVSASVSGSDYYWTGSGTDSYWSTTGNWDGNQVPPSSGLGQVIHFGARAGTRTVDLNNNLDLSYVAKLEFDNSNPASFSVIGNGIFSNNAGQLVVEQNSDLSQSISNGLGLNFSSSTLLLQGNGSGVVTLGGSLIGFNNGTGSIIGTLTKQGGSTFVLAGTSNALNSATNVQGGTLQIGNGGTGGRLGAGTVTVDAGATLAFQRSDDFTLSNTVNGQGSLTQKGNGTITLAASNGYTGTTTISAGTLKLGSSERLANTSALKVSGGTFDLGGNSETVGAVVLENGTIQAGTLTGSSYGVQAGNVSASLAGGGALTKSGNGMVVLSAQNTYTGGTNINGGTLRVSTASALGSGDVAMANGALLAIDNASDVTISNKVTGAGGLEKTSGGKLMLGGKAYTGATNVGAGTLELTGDLATADVALASGATLAGQGRLAGTGHLHGALAPSNGASQYGTLAFGGAVSLGADSKYLVDVNAPSNGSSWSAQSDFLALSAASGQLNVYMQNDAFAVGGSKTFQWTIGHVDGDHSGLSLLADGSGPNLFTVGWGGTDNGSIILSYHAVPEATTMLLGLAGMMPLVLQRRSRRRSRRRVARSLKG